MYINQSLLCDASTCIHVESGVDGLSVPDGRVVRMRGRELVSLARANGKTAALVIDAFIPKAIHAFEIVRRNHVSCIVGI